MMEDLKFSCPFLYCNYCNASQLQLKPHTVKCRRHPSDGTDDAASQAGGPWISVDLDLPQDILKIDPGPSEQKSAAEIANVRGFQT